MSEIVELSAWLKAQPEIETKKKLLFTSLIHTPSGEKVVEGFRYYFAPVEDVLVAFDADDIAALEALPFALDDDGDADTSSVCLLLAYTKKGGYFAGQVQEYQDYAPVLLREPKLLPAFDISLSQTE